VATHADAPIRVVHKTASLLLFERNNIIISMHEAAVLALSVQSVGPVVGDFQKFFVP
jgi:hypothetical protein